jgi:predicted TIM-barrel fold metal-dependent hydrolase
MAAVPTVDAHHHIWRQADLPWLQGPTLPRIFGDYDAIKRDYPIEEYLADIAGAGVVRSVYVQPNWPKDRAVDEVRWVQSIADRHGFPHAIVGFADLSDDGAAATLEAQSAFPLMRGIRQQIHWHANPQYRFADRPDIPDDPAFRRNLARLQDYGWLFELQIFAAQMAAGARLAASLPGLVLVLEHAGMPEDRSVDGRRRWREGLRRLADQPNVHTKLSGLGTFIRRNDPAHIAEVVAETVELFGAERCVWGSNFPVEKIWTDCSSILDAFNAAISHLPKSQQRAILHDNAVQLYGLG